MSTFDGLVDHPINAPDAEAVLNQIPTEKSMVPADWITPVPEVLVPLKRAEPEFATVVGPA